MLLLLITIVNLMAVDVKFDTIYNFIQKIK